MASDLRAGAILLSKDCSCVALVRRNESNLWGFPRGSVQKTSHQEAAKKIVQAETGIKLTQSFSTVTFEGVEQPGITARLFLVTGLEINELAPQPGSETDAVVAAWFPLRQVFDSDPEGSGALVAPFIPALHRYLDSHPEVFGQELLEWDGETAEELAGCMMYRRRSWRGILPVNHLAQWALTHKLPSPCYDTVNNPRVLNMQCVTCMLPHLGLQVTPDWGSVTTEDATQNAALAAIMFLAGGLGKNSPHCIVTLAGSDPAVRPLMLDNEQAQAMLQKQTEELERDETEAVKAFATQKQARDKRMAELKRHAAGVAAGGKHAEEVLKKLATMQASLPQAEQALVQAPRAIMNFPALKGRPHSALNGSSEKSAKKKAKEAPRAELQRTQMKNPIQELKEIVDRHKWQQPDYTFHGQQDDGGHMCQVSVADAGIHGIQSQPCQNQRAAKASAAMQALSQILAKGLA